MFKGRHFERSAILPCVRRYLAYGPSLRDLKETMAERGISIDHSTIHRWVAYVSPLPLKRFNRRKRSVGGKLHMDETCIKVRGRWMHLYRAMDGVGNTVEFRFSEHRDLPAAKRFLRRALTRHGRIQAKGAADDWLQAVLCGSRHTGWYRGGSHDAKAPGPFRIQPGAHAQGAVRGNRRLKCARRHAVHHPITYLQTQPDRHDAISALKLRRASAKKPKARRFAARLIAEVDTDFGSTRSSAG